MSDNCEHKTECTVDDVLNYVCDECRLQSAGDEICRSHYNQCQFGQELREMLGKMKTEGKCQ